MNLQRRYFSIPLVNILSEYRQIGNALFTLFTYNINMYMPYNTATNSIKKRTHRDHLQKHLQILYSYKQNYFSRFPRQRLMN